MMTLNLFFWILAYFIGSIPTALLVGRIAFGIDIRNYGSQNPGATNTLRVLGKKAAFVVLLVDVGKGSLAALMPSLFHVNIDPLYIGLLAVVGHCFPIFADFRGGKAIATTAGVLLVTNVWMFLIAYLAFFLMIIITKYVFVGSISVGLALLLYSMYESNATYTFIFILFAVFLLFLHRSNILNFINKQEPKVNDKKLKNDRIPPKGGSIGV